MKIKNSLYVGFIVLTIGFGAAIKSGIWENGNPKIERVEVKLGRAAEALENNSYYLTVLDVDIMQEIMALVKNYDSLTPAEQNNIQKMLKAENEEDFLNVCMQLLGYELETTTFVGAELNADEDYD